jgi:hypothetical protein
MDVRDLQLDLVQHRGRRQRVGRIRLGCVLNAAHIAAWICHKTGIPPSWSRDPANRPGVTRHLDLGAAGGGHTDPTSNLVIWRNFIRQVTHDVENTGWRRSWGTGRFVKLAV